MEYLRYEQTGPIGVLTVNRPQALNALTSAVVAELGQALDEIAAGNIRCLIVTGAGEKAFVAGADIAEMKDFTTEQARVFCLTGNAVMEKLERLPIPAIAAVNGYALGGGCELALACDIRIAADRAVFGLPETGLGVLPGYGGIQRMARLVGPAKTKELVFTGDRLKADQALALGLVNAVVPAAELMAAAWAMAEKIAANAPRGVRGAKQVANAAAGLPLAAAAGLEADSFAACFGTTDQRMAMAAFVEKKKPEPFTGN